MKTLIIATGEGFKLLQAVDVMEVKQTIVAVYDDKADAEAGLVRAKALEETIRPLWLAAIAHANKLESLMLDAVWAAAKPLEKADTAG